VDVSTFIETYRRSDGVTSGRIGGTIRLDLHPVNQIPQGQDAVAKRTVAYFTDAHLGQRLVMGGALAGNKMRYDDEPEEHRSNLRQVLDDIARKGISEVVFGGDIGTSQSVRGFFELLAGYGFTASLILGNHDAYADVTEYWDRSDGSVAGKMCYSHDDGPLKYVFLDTSDNTVGDDQLAWLARELRPASTVVLFVHHPVLAIDTPLDRAGAALKDREKLKALLTGAHCDIFAFCGHYHMDDQRSEANVRQFVTPAVSYQIVKRAERVDVDASEAAYRMIDIDGTDIRTEVVRLARPATSA
jgi:3',5'-cyclic-AMP phosphodiesterase